MKMNSVLLLRRAFSTPRGCVKWCLLLLFVTGFGCQREEILVYTVPKEKRDGPHITWTLPKGWQETSAGQMSVASFSIKGSGDSEAQVTITPLTRLAGRDAEIVNMWREQVGQEPLSREEAAKQFQTITVGGEPGNLFEISGTPRDGASAARIVTAMVHRSDKSWFYKLQGDASLVEAQKPVFIEFLKSVRINDAFVPQKAAPERAQIRPNWTVPGQWRELSPGEMQMAKFAVPQRGSAKAEVSVSMFPNDTGGTLANVNRWRRQIGLPEVETGDLASIVSPLDPSTPDAILVDMKSDSKRMLGAIVPRGGSYWFYKLVGDAEAVAPEKESFLVFVKSQP